eukprot:scaffold17213_cov57-Attheya_sp.AAC.5
MFMSSEALEIWDWVNKDWRFKYLLEGEFNDDKLEFLSGAVCILASWFNIWTFMVWGLDNIMPSLFMMT